MSIYTTRDIKTDLSGDIQISDRGDLDLADAFDTRKAAANFVLRTDFGDYAPNRTVGSNLGTFMGSSNNENIHEQMEYNIRKTLVNSIFSATDVEATVVPFDINEVLCVVNLGGSYLIDGVLQIINGNNVSYLFPFIEGSSITPFTVD